MLYNDKTPTKQGNDSCPYHGKGSDDSFNNYNEKVFDKHNSKNNLSTVVHHESELWWSLK